MARAGRATPSIRREAVPARALVVGAYLDERPQRREGSRPQRSPEARIDEAQGLAKAIDLDIVGAEIVMLSQIRPASLIGKGKLAELAGRVAADAIELVVMDCALSPVQQRNLEKAFAAKVIDRTGLILEIFGRRARTREGSLQVELAHLAYQRSRLVRSWTHLERQRGGFGFLGGPGETQIETDRRLIAERMARIEEDLAKVKRTRGLHRKTRRAVPYPVAALVGYTNAGKSTLFNHLTRAHVLAEDMLFATLDPTLRQLTLPHGAKVILSDTVGFISDLPTMLVSAFRATLEEVLEAEVILHVRDIAHDDSDAQRADVEAILAELGIGPSEAHRIVEVWNKSDLLDAQERDAMLNRAQQRERDDRPMIVSALTGQGLATLLERVEGQIGAKRQVFEIDVEASDGQGLAWLHQHAEILRKRTAPDGGTHLTARIAVERADSLRRRFGAKAREKRRGRA